MERDLDGQQSRRGHHPDIPLICMSEGNNGNIKTKDAETLKEETLRLIEDY